MKIVYAADNRPTSKYNLINFLHSLQLSNRQDIEIKIAGYSNYCDNCYWNLEALLNFSKPHSDFSIKNSNYKLLRNEISSYNPDLIISDLEPYVSLIAIELNINLYQLSPLCLYYAMDKKDKDTIRLKQFYYHIWEAHSAKNNCIDYILEKSNLNIIVSSFLSKYHFNLSSTFMTLVPDHEDFINALDKQTSLYSSINKYMIKTNNNIEQIKLSKFIEKI